MEDQSGASLRTEKEGERQQDQGHKTNTPVTNATSAHKAFAVKSILQQVALQASMLPDFVKNTMAGTPQSNQKHVGPSAETVEPSNGTASEVAYDDQVDEVAPAIVTKIWPGNEDDQDKEVATNIWPGDEADQVKEAATNIRLDDEVDRDKEVATKKWPNHDEDQDKKIAELMELESQERTRLAWDSRVQPDTIGIATSSSDGSGDHRVQAFAKLEFDDGEYYMNTYSVELGRDLGPARKSQEKENDDRSIDSRKRSQSISQEDLRKKFKSRRKKSRSTSSSQQFSRKSSSLFQTNYQGLAMASLAIDGAKGYNVDSRPETEDCTLVPIHPRTNAPGIAAGPAGQRTISRKHVKIAFNFEERIFEAKIVGRNGAFVDDQWYPEGHVLPLKNGSFIQIGGVGIRFLLPDVGYVAIGESGAEAGDSTFAFGEQMSLGYMDGRDTYNPLAHQSNGEDDGKKYHDEGEGREEVGNGDELEEVQIERESDEDEDSEEDGESEELFRPTSGKTKPKVKTMRKAKGKARNRGKAKAKAKPKSKSKAKPSSISGPNPESAPLAPKRRGPGRPPKNGIISQREEALLRKQAKERAKTAALEESGGLSRIGQEKSEDGNQEEAQSQPGVVKRKYTKRKSKDAQPVEINGVRESTEQTESVSPGQTLALNPLKKKSPPKPPRSPSPVFDESTLTPEQLAKPQSSYVVLIHEALSNSERPTMTLPQIYRAIQRRYPYFVLRVPTDGWQSSVRHNLGQHQAFEKHERQGKGHTWGLKPGVSIEKEKRRRVTPPSLPQQQYHPPAQYPGMVPPHGQIPPQMQHPYGMPPGQTLHSQTGHIPSAGPNGLLLPFVNSQVNSSSTYQSPYQSAPPVSPLEPNTQSPLLGYTNGYPYYPPNVPQSQVPGLTTSNGLPTTPYPQYVPNPHQNRSTAPDNVPKEASQCFPIPSSQHLPNPSPQLPNHHPHPSNNSPHLPNYSSQHPNPFLPSALYDPTIIDRTSPEILQAIAKFSAYLISDLPDKAHRLAIISSAITRILGPKTTEPEDAEEKTIMHALSTMLDDLKKKTKDAHRQAPQSHPVVVSPTAQQQQHPSLMTNRNPLPQSSPTAQQEATPVHLQHQIRYHSPGGGAPQAGSDTPKIPAPNSSL